VKAEIVSIGSELMAGRIADTNAAYLSEQLTELGIRVVRHTALDDCAEEIIAHLRDVSARADAAIVTGGIGPTPDDMTRQAFASLVNLPLVNMPEAEEHIRGIFATLRRPFSESNLIQATIPETAEAIPNPNGTAFGFVLKHDRCEFYCLPGVPREMKAMFEEFVRPRLEGRSGNAVCIRCVQVFGLGESSIGERLADLMAPGANPAVATQARQGMVTVRITATDPDEAAATSSASAAVSEIKKRLGNAVFAEDEKSLAERVAELLAQASLTLAVAESCTGGLVTAQLVDVPGISGNLLEGAVCYSNESKLKRLKVAPDILERHGAVSRDIAEAMATGMRETSGADLACGITGIAGPTGGTPDKPVGLVYIALADGNAVDVKELHLRGNRSIIRNRAANYALNMIRLYLERR